MKSRVAWTAWLATIVIVAALGLGAQSSSPPPSLNDDPPHEVTGASADPSTIWVETAPPSRVPKETTLTLQVHGRGVPLSQPRPQDTIFLIDASRSMLDNDPSNLRLTAAKHYVDLMAVPDRGAVVEFARFATLVRGHHLSSNYAQIKSDIDTINLASYTNLFDPIRLSTNELLANGDASHAWVEILLTDGQDTTGHSDAQIIGEAQRAADNHITIYTVGLIVDPDEVNEPLLMEIANVTNGKYLRAEDPSDLEDIYAEISAAIKGPDIAGRDNTVSALLPSYIHYVSGSATPPPNFIDVSGGGTNLLWNFSELKINATWTATLRVTSGLDGTQLYALSYPDTTVTYTRYDDLRVSLPFPETFIDVLAKLPPTADAGGPYVGVEGTAIAFTAAASSDPDGDPLTYRWDFQDDGAWDTLWSSEPLVSYTWGDDWSGTVRVEVSNGLDTDTATASVLVRDVAPEITDVQAYIVADVTLRVAGEKWHDVRMDLSWDNALTASAHVVRYPGSPDRQSGTITGGRLHLLGSFSITLYYTPADDPVNGQPNGANPVWVILTLPDGKEVRLHHTFNVQHPATWVWTISELRAYLVGQAITFDATSHDVGSDDLTFNWDFGDGATMSTIHYNNAASSDPYPSPDVSPITANDVQTHAFASEGTYTITLAVTDDDGGRTSVAFVLAVG